MRPAGRMRYRTIEPIIVPKEVPGRLDRLVARRPAGANLPTRADVRREALGAGLDALDAYVRTAAEGAPSPVRPEALSRPGRRPRGAAADSVRQESFKVTAETWGLIEGLVAAVHGRWPGPGAHRSSIVREALLRGLDGLESASGVTG